MINWKDVLAFTQKERRGVLVLIILIFFTFLGRLFIPSLLETPSGLSENASLMMDSLRSGIREREERKQNKYDYSQDQNNFNNSYNSKKTKTLKPFPFNPNTLDSQGWQKMGFSSKDAAMIMKYKASGGAFYKKEDVKKLYCVSDTDYQQLKGYIQIEDNQPRSDKQPEKFDKIIELNTADTSDLLDVPGVGPYYAKNILKYREILGGYSSPQQLSEVYGLEEKYKNLISYFKVDSSLVKPINVNDAKYYDLLKHPYIDKKLAYQITQHRRLKGEIENFPGFLKSKDIPAEKFRKIRPYLSTD